MPPESKRYTDLCLYNNTPQKHIFCLQGRHCGKRNKITEKTACFKQFSSVLKMWQSAVQKEQCTHVGKQKLTPIDDPKGFHEG